MRRPSLAFLLLVSTACTREEPAPPAPQPSAAAPAAATTPAAPPAGATTSPAASPTAAPAPAPAAAAPKPWWCACYERDVAGARSPHTACHTEQARCEALELRLAADTNDDRLTHGCRVVEAAHPGDKLGQPERWQPAAAPGDLQLAGSCALPDPPGPASNPAAADYAATETLAGFRVGMAQAEVVAVAAPKRKGKPRRDDYGNYEQIWDYPDGLQLILSGPSSGGPKTLAGITVKGSHPAVTARGIRVGSTRAELTAAYGDLFHMDSSDDQKIITTGEHSLIFSLAADAVSSIYLGSYGD